MFGMDHCFEPNLMQIGTCEPAVRSNSCPEILQYN